MLACSSGKDPSPSTSCSTRGSHPAGPGTGTGVGTRFHGQGRHPSPARARISRQGRLARRGLAGICVRKIQLGGGVWVSSPSGGGGGHNMGSHVPTYIHTCLSSSKSRPSFVLSHFPNPQKRASHLAVRRIPPAATSCSHPLCLSPPPLSPSHSRPWASDGLGTVFITTDVATHPPVFPPPLPLPVLATRTRPLASVFISRDSTTTPLPSPLQNDWPRLSGHRRPHVRTAFAASRLDCSMGRDEQKILLCVHLDRRFAVGD